ncbi:hydroxyisourate hydrolase [Evansella tamaricis]|uniref:5-hydroxyisourate hydrolase n=1 Tax=Evansella tamaricis TaxID=2069301 RepID=A0ABS6JKJ9_9BACI|nr:hydroxyisourate hydrolase [Evansella tamaricis]MBU9713910.1 hydroxyisourate hydrolase [Evansella tamaricis]
MGEIIGGGRLTTHVLDTSIGRPAENMVIELWKYRSISQTHVKVLECETNKDGRVDHPLLDGEKMKIGQYELLFHVADYFESRGVLQDELPFLNVVPVRFTISDRSAHYHVPLLIAPGGYSTYRGS